MSCTQMINFVESLPTFGPKFMVYVGNYGPKILGIFIDFPLNLLWVTQGLFLAVLDAEVFRCFCFDTSTFNRAKGCQFTIP